MAKKSKTAPAPQPATRVEPAAPAQGLSPEMAQQIQGLVDQRIGQVFQAIAQHAVQQRAGARPQAGGGPAALRGGLPMPQRMGMPLHGGR